MIFLDGLLNDPHVIQQRAPDLLIFYDFAVGQLHITDRQQELGDPHSTEQLLLLLDMMA